MAGRGGHLVGRGNRSSLDHSVPGPVLGVCAPERGETHLPSSWTNRLRPLGKGQQEVQAAEWWRLNLGLYLLAPYLPFPPTNSYLFFKPQLKCPLPLKLLLSPSVLLVFGVPAAPGPPPATLILGLWIPLLDHGPFRACPQADLHLVPRAHSAGGY